MQVPHSKSLLVHLYPTFSTPSTPGSLVLVGIAAEEDIIIYFGKGLEKNGVLRGETAGIPSPENRI
jgi:hypothetical protein